MTNPDPADHVYRFEAVMLQHNIPLARVTGDSLDDVVEAARACWGHFDFRRHRHCLYADAVQTWDTSRSAWWGKQAGLTILVTQWR